MTPITPGYASNPNSAPNPAIAYALMPTESFAQKRADKQASMYFQSQLNTVYQQQLTEKQAAVSDLQKTTSQIAELKLLSPDNRRIYAQFATPWLDKVKSIIKDEYQGDITRFKREKGDYLMGEFTQALATSPQVEKAMQNKANYGLWLKDRQDGKLAVGDMDTAYAQYQAGNRLDLPYQGSYKPPENLYDTFAKGNKQGYEYGVEAKDGKGRGTGKYNPIGVTSREVYDAMIGKGYTTQQALDYVQNKTGYRDGQWTWGMKQTDPNKLKQDAIENGFRQQGLNLQRRGQDINARERKLDREQRARENGGAGSGIPSYAERIFDQKNYTGTYTPTEGYRRDLPAQTGITGPLKDALLEAVGYRKGSEYTTYLDGNPKSEDPKNAVQTFALTPGAVTYRTGKGTVTRPALLTPDGRRVYALKDGVARQVTEVDASRIVLIDAEPLGGAKGEKIYAMPGKAIVGGTDRNPKVVPVMAPLSQEMATQMGLTDRTNFGTPKQRGPALNETMDDYSGSPADILNSIDPR